MTDEPQGPGRQRPRRRLKWPLIAAIVVIVAAVGITGYLVINAHRYPASQSAPTYRQTVLRLAASAAPTVWRWAPPVTCMSPTPTAARW